MLSSRLCATIRSPVNGLIMNVFPDVLEGVTCSRAYVTTPSLLRSGSTAVILVNVDPTGVV